MKFDHLSFENNLPALAIKKRVYTYAELYERIIYFRNIIHCSGMIDEKLPVAIFSIPTLDTYAAILALWTEGISYVPLNIRYTQERIDYVLNLLDIKYCVGGDKVNYEMSNIEELALVKTRAKKELDTQVEISDLFDTKIAYFLFTSGSTGVPKGVPITFKNLKTFIKSFSEIGLGYNSETKAIQMFELNFDVSISSFLPTLLAGGCVYPIDNEGIKYLNVIKSINELDLTHLQLVPSIIDLGGKWFERLYSENVKVCILTGEASRKHHYQIISKCFPNARLFNFYGPTEVTIYSSYYEVKLPDIKINNEIVSIGKPLNKEMEFCLLGDANVTSDFYGELCISSGQVMSGYLNSEQFPFIDINNLRYYRTGDFIKKDRQGDYLYEGRKDGQVKLNGYRIELGDIENAIYKTSKRNSVAFVCSSNQHIDELILFIEGEEYDVKTDLKLHLPEYMVPSKYFFMKSFPLNQSEKIDRGGIKQRYYEFIND